MTKIQRFRHESATASLTLWGNETATLSSLHAKVPHRGHGGALMGIIGAYADTHGLILLLDAKPFGHASLTREQLEAFYFKHGFDVVRTSRETGMHMRRIPHPPQEIQTP